MTLERIDIAKEEAQRFLEKIELLEDSFTRIGSSSMTTGTKESGAVKRASLDLSRALSDMRKPS